MAVPLFFVLFTYSFLLDQALYLNHLYLVCLLAFLLSFMPANRAFSIDAWLWPRLRSQTTPAWTIWMLRFQMGVVYFYGGVAKISPDWLRGEPMRTWMARRTEFPLIGQYFREEWAVYFISYGGLLLDLLIVPFLLWRRTRVAAFIVAILFHVMNARMFQIGIFPWLGIAATAMFFPPDWPRRIFNWLGDAKKRKPKKTGESLAAMPRFAGIALTFIGLYVAIQILAAAAPLALSRARRLDLRRPPLQLAHETARSRCAREVLRHRREQLPSIRGAAARVSCDGCRPRKWRRAPT